MRPGQKNRMRGGRGNNAGRRGPNPLTRSYESNGPDVKVRGTPQHIAEKYVQLARDAHSSGDTVMAEAYLQHAEHYYRIIAAAQNAQQQAWNQANGIPVSEAEAPEDEDEFEVAGADRFTFRAPQNFQQPGAANGQPGNLNQQQPYQQVQPYGQDPGAGDQPPMPEGQPMAGEGGQQGYPQQQRQRDDRQFGNRNRFDRRFGRDRGDRNFGDRNQGDRNYGDRNFDRQGSERGQGGDRVPEGERNFGNGRPQGDRNGGERQQFQPRQEHGGRDDSPRDDNADSGRDEAGLPSFITGSSRAQAVEEAPRDEAAEGETGIRRRRRRTRPETPAAGEE
jgi:hypothetical protein